MALHISINVLCIPILCTVNYSKQLVISVASCNLAPIFHDSNLSLDGSAAQAALFAEEADRASALRAQRSECDVLLLQAEARHRIALQKLRSELAEAQAKQKEASAAERLALQAAVRAESIWPALDMPDMEDVGRVEQT